MVVVPDETVPMLFAVRFTPPDSVWSAVPRTATVSVTGGNVSVKFDAPALALVSVVAPVDEPSMAISLFVKVWSAVQVCAVPIPASVSLAAGKVSVKFEALEFAEVKVVAPVDDPSSLISELVNV